MRPNLFFLQLWNPSLAKIVEFDDFCVSGSWVAFENTGFSGEPYILEKGLYATPEDWGALNFKISSIQPILHVRKLVTGHIFRYMFIKIHFPNKLDRAEVNSTVFFFFLQETLIERNKHKVSVHLWQPLHDGSAHPLEPSQWFNVSVLVLVGVVFGAKLSRKTAGSGAQYSSSGGRLHTQVL